MVRAGGQRHLRPPPLLDDWATRLQDHLIIQHEAHLGIGMEFQCIDAGLGQHFAGPRDLADADLDWTAGWAESLSEKVECRPAERRNRGEQGRTRPTRRAKVVA